MSEKVTGASPISGEGIRGDGQAHWYVVHTYSGHEKKVKTSIEKMVENRGMQDEIVEVSIPMDDILDSKTGKIRKEAKKRFPGYVLIKMIVNNETWYLVRNTQGVTGFVGNGANPIPLTKEETVRMGVEKVHIDLDMEVGETIKVISGPFEGFVAVIEKINPEKQTLGVKMTVLGRETPVELEFRNVDKLDG